MIASSRLPNGSSVFWMHATADYLRTPLADLLPAGHSEEDLELAEQALEVVQSLEPVESPLAN